MTVNRQCRKKDLAATLDTGAGERLRYSISYTGARAVFTLVNKQGTLILSQTSPPGLPGPWEVVWPAPDAQFEPPAEFTHVMGMHFLAAASYTYKITKEDAAGNVIQVVKDCDYTADEPDDVFFEPLTIFVD